MGSSRSILSGGPAKFAGRFYRDHGEGAVMTELTTEERILNGFLRVILDCELNAAERQAAAASLRSGRLVECLLSVLEFTDEKRHPSEVSHSQPAAAEKAALARPVDSNEKRAQRSKSELLSPDELFDLVRKRKVSKSALTDIIERLNSGIVLSVGDDASMREILHVFKSVASDAEWITLTRAVNGQIVNDSYLNRILGR